MYQHPAALDLNASHYRHEAMLEARNRRLVHEAQSAPDQHTDSTSPFQRRLVAVAVALVTVLGVVVLI